MGRAPKLRLYSLISFAAAHGFFRSGRRNFISSPLRWRQRIVAAALYKRRILSLYGTALIKCPLQEWFPIGQYRNDLRLDWLAGDFDVLVGNVNVDLRSDAELSFLVNSGLDRKTNSGSDASGIARLEIIDVDAVAMGLFANGMAGAMGELFAEPGARNYTARYIVHVSATNRFSVANIFADKFDRRIAGVAPQGLNFG